MVWGSVYLRRPSRPWRRPRPGRLHAAHGGVHARPGRGVAVVDVDRARLQAPGDGPAPPGVAAIDAGVEPVGRVVGPGHRLVVRRHRVDRHHRAERLVPAHVHLGGDTGQHRGLEEQRSQVGAGLASGHQAGALGQRVLDVGGDLVQLVRRGEGSHLGAVRLLGAQAQGGGAGTERLGELVGQRLLHVDALDGDAQLAGVGERADHGTLDRPVQLDVAGDDHGVLAAQLGRHADELLARLAGDAPPGGRRAREHHVVGGLDDGGAHGGARSGHDLDQPGGQPGFLQQLEGAQGGERRLGVGLDDDAVPGHQGGDGVGGGQHQRVVPRRDHPDHALGDVLDPGGHQAGQRGPPPVRAQGPGGQAGVVPGGDRLVHDLLERPHPGLAVLGLDEVEQLALPVQHQVVVAEQDRGPLPHRALGPGALRLAGDGEGGGDVLGGADGHLAQHLAGERGEDLVPLPAAGRGHPGGQPIGLGPIRPQRRDGRRGVGGGRRGVGGGHGGPPLGVAVGPTVSTCRRPARSSPSASAPGTPSR